jgi:Zn-dependent protease
VVFLWIFSVCLHEFAHAIVAYRGGDKSVKDKGYLSLNPMNYLDPFSSILMPVLILVLGGLGLPGAAVYINRAALRSRGWETAVALAGPLMNLVILLVTAIVIQFLHLQSTTIGMALAFFAFLQASAIVLNLLPIPGFDGFAAIEPYLPIEAQILARQAAPAAIMVFICVVFFVPGVGGAISGACLKLAYFFGVEPYNIIAGLSEFRFWKR